MPAALVPLLAPVDSIPTRGSGKVDRDALPWPLERAGEESAPPVGLTATGEWVAQSTWEPDRASSSRAPISRRIEVKDRAASGSSRQ